MTLNQQLLETYLDGELPAAQAAAVDQALKANPAAQRLLAALRSQRALRAAALRTYLPTSAEAATLATPILDQLHAPVGKITPNRWLRRLGAIAAALILTAGAFSLGRLSAPTSTSTAVLPNPTQPVATASFRVTITDKDGNTVNKDFDTLADAQSYASQWTQQVADSNTTTTSTDTPLIPATGSL